jgi:diguanylate cyclase (GGDEF)-like protein
MKQAAAWQQASMAPATPAQMSSARVLPTGALEDALALWLKGPAWRLNPGFPAPIETVFESDRGQERMRALKISTLTRCVTGAVMVPFLWAMLPDIHGAILLLWVAIALPAGLIGHAALWGRAGLAVQEWQVTACALLFGACFSLLMARSQFGLPSLYLGGMMLILLLEAVAGGLRFRPLCVLAGGMLLMFGATTPFLPRMNALLSSALIAVMAIVAGYALFGHWRLETEIRRSYALALRERLARQQLAQDNAMLDDLAGRDALTSLANRRTYDRWLGAQWSRAAQSGSMLGLVIIDIDHFKSFNDYYGHAAGDACLQAVALCLRDQSRGMSDNVARLGGEEFALLLPGLGLDACGEVAERLRAAVAALELPHIAGDAQGSLTISCGVASAKAHPGNAAADLFRAADIAMYAAKAAGRNCIRMGEASLAVAGAASGA